MNFKSLKQLYFSLIHSHLNYSNISWASHFKSKLNGLWLKQKHAVRIVFRKYILFPSRPLLKDLGALNVYQINLMKTLSFMHRARNIQSPKSFKSRTKAKLLECNHELTFY